MGWFNFLFLAAFVLALVTGKAYFRKVVPRDQDPRQYWSIIGCYLVLGLMPLGLRILSHMNIGSATTRLLSDAATRIAFDLEKGVRIMDKAHSNTYTVQHHPLSWPDGCTADFRVQLSERSMLLVWCLQADKVATSSHTTTYHLNFVAVPKTFIVDKATGETVFIDLERQAGRPTVVGLH